MKILLIVTICIVAYIIQLICFYGKPYKIYCKECRQNCTIGGLIEYANNTVGEAYGWYALTPFFGPIILLVTVILFLIKDMFKGIGDTIKSIKL